MKLFTMTKEEYQFWRKRSSLDYAQDKMKANDYTAEDAAKIAKTDFDRALPNGLDTANSYLYTAKNEAGDCLGFIWVNIKGEEKDKRAFILDVIIEEKYRGQGYGKELMTLLEVEMKKIHVARIGLHVFGFNDRAINLYKTLGYLTTDLQMEKKLD